MVTHLIGSGQPFYGSPHGQAKYRSPFFLLFFSSLPTGIPAWRFGQECSSGGRAVQYTHFYCIFFFR